MNPFAACREVLIGLEFTIHFDGKSECPYVCVMCKKKGSFKHIISHLISYSHRTKFLGICYPSVYAASYNRNVVPDLCQEIEKTWGRKSPVSTNGQHLNMILKTVQSRIENGRDWAMKELKNPDPDPAIKKLMMIATRLNNYDWNNNNSVDLTTPSPARSKFDENSSNSKGSQSLLTYSEEADNASDCEIIEPVRVIIEISGDEQECENPSKRHKTETESVLPGKIEPEVLQEVKLPQSTVQVMHNMHRCIIDTLW